MLENLTAASASSDDRVRITVEHRIYLSSFHHGIVLFTMPKTCESASETRDSHFAQTGGGRPVDRDGTKLSSKARHGSRFIEGYACSRRGPHFGATTAIHSEISG
eukprot:765192-Hanusia_phi.AAC.1